MSSTDLSSSDGAQDYTLRTFPTDLEDFLDLVTKAREHLEWEYGDPEPRGTQPRVADVVAAVAEVADALYTDVQNGRIGDMAREDPACDHVECQNRGRAFKALHNQAMELCSAMSAAHATIYRLAWNEAITRRLASPAGSVDSREGDMAEIIRLRGEVQHYREREYVLEKEVRDVRYQLNLETVKRSSTFGPGAHASTAQEEEEAPGFLEKIHMPAPKIEAPWIDKMRQPTPPLGTCRDCGRSSPKPWGPFVGGLTEPIGHLKYAYRHQGSVVGSPEQLDSQHSIFKSRSDSIDEPAPGANGQEDPLAWEADLSAVPSNLRIPNAPPGVKGLEPDLNTLLERFNSLDEEDFANLSRSTVAQEEEPVQSSHRDDPESRNGPPTIFDIEDDECLAVHGLFSQPGRSVADEFSIFVDHAESSDESDDDDRGGDTVQNTIRTLRKGNHQAVEITMANIQLRSENQSLRKLLTAVKAAMSEYKRIVDFLKAASGTPGLMRVIFGEDFVTEDTVDQQPWPRVLDPMPCAEDEESSPGEGLDELWRMVREAEHDYKEIAEAVTESRSSDDFKETDDGVKGGEESQVTENEDGDGWPGSKTDPGPEAECELGLEAMFDLRSSDEVDGAKQHVTARLSPLAKLLLTMQLGWQWALALLHAVRPGFVAGVSLAMAVPLGGVSLVVTLLCGGVNLAQKMLKPAWQRAFAMLHLVQSICIAGFNPAREILSGSITAWAAARGFARTVLGVSLFRICLIAGGCLLWMTVQRHVALQRERAIWLSANGQTRNYMLVQSGPDSSWLPEMGIDASLMLQQGDYERWANAVCQTWILWVGYATTWVVSGWKSSKEHWCLGLWGAYLLCTI